MTYQKQPSPHRSLCSHVAHDVCVIVVHQVALAEPSWGCQAWSQEHNAKLCESIAPHGRFTSYNFIDLLSTSYIFNLVALVIENRIKRPFRGLKSKFGSKPASLVNCSPGPHAMHGRIPLCSGCAWMPHMRENQSGAIFFQRYCGARSRCPSVRTYTFLHSHIERTLTAANSGTESCVTRSGK